MSTIVIVLAAVFFLGMGSFALASPAALIRPFGITLPIPESRAEVRAVYGGFGLAIACLNGSSGTRGHPHYGRRGAGGYGFRTVGVRGDRPAKGLLSELVLLPG